MAEHLELGKLGEDIAAQYLLEQGYQILHRNYRIGRAEFDFVVRNPSRELCFVEVKALKSEDQYPETAVNYHKENMLKDGASAYKEKMNLDEWSYFEIVAINIQSRDKYQIFHIKDALY